MRLLVQHALKKFPNQQQQSRNHFFAAWEKAFPKLAGEISGCRVKEDTIYLHPSSPMLCHALQLSKDSILKQLKATASEQNIAVQHLQHIVFY